MTLALTALTILLYLSAAVIQYLGLKNRVAYARGGVFLLGFPAVVLHALLLHWWIDIGIGQNLSFFNMASLVIWLVALLILLTAIRKPVESLGLFIFPLAAVSMLLVLWFPSQYVINTAADPKQLVHILLSVLTFSILCLAGLQAIFLAIQEHQLRYMRSGGIIEKLPPLETMEMLLFQMIWIGFVLLSVVIVTGIYFFHEILWQHLLQKTTLVIVAWIVFAILLTNRYLFGWRGRKAIYATLIGVVLLIIAYFGSKIVAELLV